MRVTDQNLVKAAITDPDCVRRLAVWLASRECPTRGERELLDRATQVLTVWSESDE